MSTRARCRSLLGRSLTAVVLALALCPWAATTSFAKASGAPHTYIGAQGKSPAPLGEHAVVTKAERGCSIEVKPGAAWARASMRGGPKNIASYAHMTLRVRSSNATSAPSLQIRDTANVVASLRVPAIPKAWADMKLPLGDFRAAPGFNPTSIKTVSLVWYKTQGHRVDIADLSIHQGEGTWRHDPKVLAERVFGARRMKSVSRVKTKHFDLWTDASSAKRKLPKLMEAIVKRASKQLGLTDKDVDGYRLPVYVFKSSKEFRAYGKRVYGWTDEAATRANAAGSYWSLTLHYQGKGEETLTRRIGKSLWQHLIGHGGGAWLDDGFGEMCVAALKKQTCTKNILSRIKSGDHWSLAGLVRADKLYKTDTKQRYDYRPVYQLAGSVVEFLIHAPDAFATFPKDENDKPSTRLALQSLANTHQSGNKRVKAVERLLGRSMDQVQSTWKAWALVFGKRK